jgi:hypothetical protein
MKCVTEIRPLSEAELDNVSGGGWVNPPNSFEADNRNRAAGFTKNPEHELLPEYRRSLLSASGPQPPAIFG